MFKGRLFDGKLVFGPLEIEEASCSWDTMFGRNSGGGTGNVLQGGGGRPNTATGGGMLALKSPGTGGGGRLSLAPEIVLKQS